MSLPHFCDNQHYAKKRTQNIPLFLLFLNYQTIYLFIQTLSLLITSAVSYSIQVQHIPELSRPETEVSLRDTDFKVHFGRTDLKNVNRSLITNRAVGISEEATK